MTPVLGFKNLLEQLTECRNILITRLPMEEMALSLESSHVHRASLQTLFLWVFMEASSYRSD